MRERIFDLFVQSERGLDRSAGGLGVGLTLSRRIIELHGGTLEARSAGPGQGSEFVVRLPASGAPPVATPADEPTAGVLVLGQRVLVVDDHADAADSTAMLLRLWGFDVEIAHDGLAAVRRAQESRPHCVILDLGLPRVDGYEAARRIRSLPGYGPTVMLVAVTGYGQPEDRERTHRAGFDHHLTKPVDPEQLHTLLVGSAGHPVAG
jgi:two-component system CheB/CheR fusion protein